MNDITLRKWISKFSDTNLNIFIQYDSDKYYHAIYFDPNHFLTATEQLIFDALLDFRLYSVTFYDDSQAIHLNGMHLNENEVLKIIYPGRQSFKDIKIGQIFTLVDDCNSKFNDCYLMKTSVIVEGTIVKNAIIVKANGITALHVGTVCNISDSTLVDLVYGDVLIKGCKHGM